MDDYLSEIDETKIGIGGIKFSPELVHYTHHAVSPDDRSLADLLRRLAERRINLTFICSSAVGDVGHCTFCVAAGDFDQVEMLLDANPPLGRQAPLCSLGGRSGPGGPSLREQLQILRGVGTLTLFPHRRNLALLGRVVEVLAKSGIVIHSLCTSISALAINIDYPLLDQAVEVLERITVLPDNHAPFRPEFCVEQIAS